MQDAAYVVDGGFAQAFELFINHHGAYAVVHIDFQQQSAVSGKGQDVTAFYTVLTSFDAVLQIKGRVAGLLGVGKVGQQFFGGSQRQFGVYGVVFTEGFTGLQPDTGYFGQKNQFVGLQLNGHAGGDFFHGQVKRFAGGRKAEGRQQHHRAELQRAPNADRVHLAHQARVFEINPIDYADRPCGDEVARDHAHRRAGHGRVGQALAEGGFNLVAQLPGGFLGAVQRHRISDAHAV